MQHMGFQHGAEIGYLVLTMHINWPSIFLYFNSACCLVIYFQPKHEQ